MIFSCLLHTISAHETQFAPEFCTGGPNLDAPWGRAALRSSAPVAVASPEKYVVLISAGGSTRLERVSSTSTVLCVRRSSA